MVLPSPSITHGEDCILFGFVQNWFVPEASPIGVDLGTDSLRLAQVDPLGGGEFRLMAAASTEIPFQLRHDPIGRLKFFADSIRPLLKAGNFRGRRAGAQSSRRIDVHPATADGTYE